MDVRRRLRNGKGETKDDPEEPTQEWRPFWVPHCLLQPPRPSLNSKGQTQPATNEGSEGIQKEKRVTLWGLVLLVGGRAVLKSLLQISEFFCRNQDPHPGRGWAQAQGGWNQRLMVEIPRRPSCYLTANQSEEGHTPAALSPNVAPIKASSLEHIWSFEQAPPCSTCMALK